MENETVITESNTPDIHIESHDVEMYYKDGTRFATQVQDENNNPLSNVSVTYSLNNMNYTRKSNENGYSSLAINLDSGKYSITTTANGKISVNNTINIKSTIYSSDVVKIYRNSTQYYAKFLDTNGEVLKNTPVTFNINGVFYTRVTNDSGIGKLNINLNQGTYILTATNSKTSEMRSNTITVLPLITNNKDIVKYYKNATKYKVTILEKNGETAGSGHVVEFNINGVFYYRQTNMYGIASLNLNLDPGQYIITAQYESCSVSNTIKILPTLTARDIQMEYKDGTKFKAYLVDGTGKPAEYEKVTFNINGVLYTRTTDENGMASLNINLIVGEYIITSQHNGLSVANKIIIEPQSEKEIIKNTNFTYEIKVPNYVNVTCPYVYENSIYSLKTGADGIIRMEKNQLINIQIENDYYTFSTGNMPEYGATYLGSEYYLLPFDNSPTQHSYKIEKLTGNGIILHRSSNYTHFIYRNNCSENVEQFGAYIDKSMDNSEIINYVQNGQTIAKIQFQTISFDEFGLKYSLSKLYGCTVYDFDYKSYGEITKGNIDKIRFANTGKSVTFDYFGTKIVGYISEENIVTGFSSSNCIEFEKEELITYGLSDKYKGDFDVMQSFILINKKIDGKIVNEWILKENDYKSSAGMQSMYTMFMTSLNTAYLSDRLSDELMADYDVKWRRTNNTVILGAMNWKDTYHHVLSPNMGRFIQGNNESEIIKYRFVNSVLLSKIEEYSLKPIADDGDINITSTFDDVFESLASFKTSIVYYNNSAIITDESGNSTFLIDLTTGLVTPLLIKDGFAYKGITISRDCGLCSANSMLKGVMLNINNGVYEIDSVLDYIGDNVQPLVSFAFKGALVAKGVVGALIGGSATLGLSIIGTASSIQGIGVYFVEHFVEDENVHSAYDYVTFTRPGYLQNTKIYNIPQKDGSVDYIEIPIKKDNSYDRENVKYISKGSVKTLTKEDTYKYFTEESWSPYSIPQKYWR
ncbi:carboxypeptidase-like regulatory domain-containing protein [Methanobrevibacter sp.]|uniref:carboxypeptidase-like regulatory domain-containing protein n=1 Tax=Methanobrevibacter sp. TaxID=66852 RepID=UPI00388F20A9